MTAEYTVVFSAGTRLPNGADAYGLYMRIDARDREDAWNRLWDYARVDALQADIYNLDESAQLDLAGRREVIADQWLIVNRCTSCQARVIRAIAYSNLARVWVDAERDSDCGTVAITRPGDPDGTPVVRKVSVASRFGRRDLHNIHRCRTRRHTPGVTS